MNLKHRILQILTSSDDHLLLENELAIEEIEFVPKIVANKTQFFETVQKTQPEVVITDYQHPGYNAIEALAESKLAFPDVIFIVFTQSISELDAVECIKAGVSNIVNVDQVSSVPMIILETLKFQQAKLEKKQIEEQLAKEREILAISLASIGEAIISIDLSGKVVLFNRAAEELTGFSKQDAEGEVLQKVFRLLDEKTNKLIEDPLSHLLEIEEKSQKNLPTKRPVLLTNENTRILISGKITPILVDQKKHIGYVIVFDDVTQKELMAAQSLLSSKMESIGQLAAGIAHEINTPIQYLGDNLNYINHTIEVLEEIDQKQFDLIKLVAQQKKFQKYEEDIVELRKKKRVDHFYSEGPVAVKESLEGIERVRKIVLAIREFSHSTVRENLLSDINKGILTTITISRNEWKYCADLETDLDPNLPMVWCRIDELNQVLLNMIVNATHAIKEKQKNSTPEKGKITIKTTHTDERVFITITDTGCGIPDEIVGRIFDPFFTTKEVGKGTGQGLSLAHNIIVNNHHGMIHVQSIINVGTTFTIELPIKQQEID